jgi:hypothetical protein
MKPGLASILPTPPTDMSAVMAAKAKIDALLNMTGTMTTTMMPGTTGKKPDIFAFGLTAKLSLKA